MSIPAFTSHLGRCPKVEFRRNHYNGERPHSALRNLSPATSNHRPVSPLVPLNVQLEIRSWNLRKVTYADGS